MAMQNSKVALISVTDKTGVVELARELVNLGFMILSTGGSAKLLADNDVAVTEVAEFTGSPEILSGRVKTLHPKVHGGILFDRSNPLHVTEMSTMGYRAIDMVVVNLYQFEQNVVAKNLGVDKAIEFIDVGGPTMLRAAAKNHRHCLPVVDPRDYPQVLAELRYGEVTLKTRIELAAKVFDATAKYDAMIAGYLLKGAATSGEQEQSALPANLNLELTCALPLRYGENPHQSAGFYRLKNPEFQESGLADAKVLQGKELSYNNLLDIDAAAALVADFSHMNCIAIIKHTNPCGIAASAHEPLLTIYQKALAGDPKSAFGGIIATNATIDEGTAAAICTTFYECIAAPAFTEAALVLFSAKKNLRLLILPMLERGRQPKKTTSLTMRSIHGGILMQSRDDVVPKAADLTPVTSKTPTSAQVDDLLFAMTVCKHVKSNAIVYAKDLATIVVGAGQMSRIDSATFAASKAQEDGKNLTGAVMASDAFFPFRDNVDLAARFGIRAIIQPGGSVRDQESITACNEHGIAMVFTGKRHFKH